MSTKNAKQIFMREHPQAIVQYTQWGDDDGVPVLGIAFTDPSDQHRYLEEWRFTKDPATKEWKYFKEPTSQLWRYFYKAHPEAQIRGSGQRKGNLSGPSLLVFEVNWQDKNGKDVVSIWHCQTLDVVGTVSCEEVTPLNEAGS